MKVGEVVHWQCERRGVCKARVHTQGSQIVKRANEHLHELDEEAVTCQLVKIGMKRKESETQDSTRLIVGDNLLTVSEGVSVKLPKLTNLKRTIQRQRARISDIFEYSFVSKKFLIFVLSRRLGLFDSFVSKRIFVELLLFLTIFGSF